MDILNHFIVFSMLQFNVIVPDKPHWGNSNKGYMFVCILIMFSESVLWDSLS